jgi:2'-deoxynucleoside 5'-phosphate N-hydrolase
MAKERVLNYMQVYFACSISGGRDSAHLYQGIVDAIKDNGAELLSELFADQTIDANKGKSLKKNMSKKDIWECDLNWVSEADLIIAEVTQPSLGVGYEIAKAEEWGKPILCLFYSPSGRRLSAMIEGSTLSETKYYDSKESAAKIIKTFIKKYS